MSATLHSLASVLLAWLLEALVTGTLVAALTAALASTLLRRASPALHAWLWTIALLKFVVPSGVASFLSLRALASRVVPTQAAIWLEPAQIVADAHGQARDWPALSVAMALYLAIVAALTLRAARAHLRMRRAVAALPLAPDPLGHAVSAAAARVGLGALPAVRVAPGEGSPFVFGLWRPVLVVPGWERHQPARLGAILGHELAHLARRDPWIRALGLVVRTLFFFWPVATWLCRRLEEAQELACDARALERTDLAPADYARCLLEIARASQHPRAQALAMASPAAKLERRIDMILSDRKRAAGRWSIPATLIWAGLALATSARAAPPGASANPAEGKVGLDGSQIRLVIMTHIDEISECYKRELDAHPSLAGKVNIRFTIRRDGTVGDAHIMESSLHSEAVESCLVLTVSGLLFPRPRGNGTIQVNYPFVFNSKGY